ANFERSDRLQVFEFQIKIGGSIAATANQGRPKKNRGDVSPCFCHLRQGSWHPAILIHCQEPCASGISPRFTFGWWWNVALLPREPWAVLATATMLLDTMDERSTRRESQ